MGSQASNSKIAVWKSSAFSITYKLNGKMKNSSSAVGYFISQFLVEVEIYWCNKEFKRNPFYSLSFQIQLEVLLDTWKNEQFSLSSAIIRKIS